MIHLEEHMGDKLICSDTHKSQRRMNVCEHYELTYSYSLVIDKDLCESDRKRIISVSLCSFSLFLPLISGDFFIFSVRVVPFYSCFCEEKNIHTHTHTKMIIYWIQTSEKIWAKRACENISPCPCITCCGNAGCYAVW